MSDSPIAPHEFSERSHKEREKDPDHQNQCAACNGWATDPQHGGQYATDVRQVIEDDKRVVRGSCGWCTWVGPRHLGWINRSIRRAEREADQHLMDAHNNTPPDGRITEWQTSGLRSTE